VCRNLEIVCNSVLFSSDVCIKHALSKSEGSTINVQGKFITMFTRDHSTSKALYVTVYNMLGFCSGGLL
jgi:hypothetical protein